MNSIKPGNHPKLSVCMIVRDAAHTLRPCLMSIRDWVDEMIVVDTGSIDRTPEIAQELGAKVSHFPWIDDFSAARNESLRLASGEWLFWMDADDTIDADNGAQLRELARGAHNPQVLGYVCQVYCPSCRRGAPDGLTVVDHVKLIRNHPLIRFEFRIHEQVLPAMRRLGGEIQWTDIHVVHSGADQTPDGIQKKYERDLRILQLELRDRPDHPFVLFNLGMTYNDMGEHEEGVTYLRRSLDVSASDESHVRKAYALLVASLEQLGQQEQAYEVCQRGRQLYPDDPELLFRQGLLAHARGHLEAAEQSYRAVLQNQSERHFSSIDPGILGYKSRHNLALVYQDMGQPELAELQWRHSVSALPSFRPARRSLVETLIHQQRSCTAEIEIESMLNEEALRCDALVLTGLLAGARGDLTRAKEHLTGAVRDYPDDVEPLQSLCRFLFEHGELSEAEQALQCLISAQPTDGAAHHNLGVVYTRLGKRTEAAESFRQSLDVRPESLETQRLLAEAQALDHV